MAPCAMRSCHMFSRPCDAATCSSVRRCKPIRFGSPPAFRCALTRATSPTRHALTILITASLGFWYRSRPRLTTLRIFLVAGTSLSALGVFLYWQEGSIDLLVVGGHGGWLVMVGGGLSTTSVRTTLPTNK